MNSVNSNTALIKVSFHLKKKMMMMAIPCMIIILELTMKTLTMARTMKMPTEKKLPVKKTKRTAILRMKTTVTMTTTIVMGRLYHDEKEIQEPDAFYDEMRYNINR